MNRKIISNFIWRFAERCGAQSVAFVVSVVLARLLDPSTYGQLALVTVITSLLQVFVDSGLGTALIQKKDTDDLDYSSVFYFNLAFCLLLYAGLFFAAPLIARLYEAPELQPVIRTLGLTVVISGLKNVQQSYVSKTMQFKRFFFSSLGSNIASGVVGIAMALKGYGIWALVGQSLTSTGVNTLILWFTVGWHPKKAFSLQRVKRLLGFGWKLLASSLISTFYDKLRHLIIGLMYSTADLAYYDKGHQYPNLVVSSIGSAIDSVLLPTMAEAQDEKTRLRGMTRRSIRVSTYVMAPMMLGLSACAESVVRLLLTEKWMGAVFFLRIFCITMMFHPIHTANLNAIKALGRSDWFLKLEIAKKVVGLALLLGSMWISVEAMAYSLFISTLTGTLINTYPNKKLLGYRWAEQMKDILPNLALAAGMAVPVYFLQYLPLGDFPLLVLQVLTGAAIYIGLSALLKMECFVYLWGNARSFLKGAKKRTSEKKEQTQVP